MIMQEVFDKLRSLQEILSEKYEVEKKIDEIPKALATKIELLNRLKKSYIQKNEELEKTKQRIKSTRQRMYDAEAERETYEKKMDLIKTQREYEALDKEIKEATDREQELRRDLQNQEKALEEMQGNLEREETMIKRQEEDVKSEQSRIKHELKEKNKVMQKLAKDEDKITPGLDEDILFKFERIIRSKSGLGIVPVVDGVCTGCYMRLPPQFVNAVRISNDIMFCPECSRILYYAEKEKAPDVSDIFHMDEAEEEETKDEHLIEEERAGSEIEGEGEEEKILEAEGEIDEEVDEAEEEDEDEEETLDEDEEALEEEEEEDEDEEE